MYVGLTLTFHITYTSLILTLYHVQRRRYQRPISIFTALPTTFGYK